MIDRGRGGFALVLAILAVVMAGALIVATHVAVTLEHSVAVSGLDRQRAFAASEYGLWTTVGDWDDANANLERGGEIVKIVRVLRDSATVRTVRLNETLYWVVAEAEVGDARRRTGMNVRVIADTTGRLVEPVRRSWVEAH